MKRLLAALTLLLPWPLRRQLLVRFWGYELHPEARIGLAWVFPKRLVMAAGSRIDHLTFCKGLEELRLDEHAYIGRLNWITGFPKGPSRHFAHQSDRYPALVVERHAAITNRHLIDCTDTVHIGAFATVAGFRSQILTHSIDLQHCRQSAAPVRIGSYCFVGTACIVLGGSRLPDYSVLGAGSLLRQAFCDTHTLYAGVPAAPRKALPPDWKYFARTEGFIW